jgi:ribosomal protein S18 acetylase RimI-like enzyme
MTDPMSPDAAEWGIEHATEETLHGWLTVHNVLIPNAPLTLADARERLSRHRLLVAITDDRRVIGSTTVRPPEDEPSTVTVIARVLPRFQRAGIGRALYESAMRQVAEYQPTRVMTCVLASNERGLAFAGRLGFVEVERYVLDGDDVAFVDLALDVRTDEDEREAQ